MTVIKIKEDTVIVSLDAWEKEAEILKRGSVAFDKESRIRLRDLLYEISGKAGVSLSRSTLVESFGSKDLGFQLLISCARNGDRQLSAKGR